jgi:hypothetical protein
MIPKRFRNGNSRKNLRGIIFFAKSRHIFIKIIVYLIFDGYRSKMKIQTNTQVIKVLFFDNKDNYNTKIIRKQQHIDSITRKSNIKEDC